MLAYAKLNDKILVMEILMMEDRELFRTMAKVQFGASHVWLEDEVGTEFDPTTKKKDYWDVSAN